MNTLKTLLKVLLCAVFVASATSFMLTFNIRQFATSRNTFATASENPRVINAIKDEFTARMSKDFIKILAHAIPEAELKKAFENSYPVDDLKVVVRDGFVKLHEYLSERTDEYDYQLPLGVFNRSIGSFLESKAAEAKDEKKKALILKYVGFVKEFATEIPFLFREQLQTIDEARMKISELKTPMIVSGVVAGAAILLLLLLDQVFLGIGAALAGLSGIGIGAFMSFGIEKFIPPEVVEPARSIVVHIVYKTGMAGIFISLAVLVAGSIIFLKFKKPGGK